ncbi:MAG TPA: Flp family type IVb pilin [Mycobacteriales bacterium]|nr:Flp family type IVb pilin [Mycobacteriales bacterium]
MHTMYTAIARVRRAFRNDDSGATAVEYGLMVALIAAVIAGVVYTLGQTLNSKFTTVSNCVQTPNSSSACPVTSSSP